MEDQDPAGPTPVGNSDPGSADPNPVAGSGGGAPAAGADADAKLFDDFNAKYPSNADKAKGYYNLLKQHNVLSQENRALTERVQAPAPAAEEPEPEEHELEDAGEDLDTAKADLAGVDTRIRGIVGKATALHQEVAKLTGKLEATDDEDVAARIKGQIRDIEAEQSRLKERYDEARSALTAAARQVKKAEREKERVSQRVERAQQRQADAAKDEDKRIKDFGASTSRTIDSEIADQSIPDDEQKACWNAVKNATAVAFWDAARAGTILNMPAFVKGAVADYRATLERAERRTGKQLSDAGKGRRVEPTASSRGGPAAQAPQRDSNAPKLSKHELARAKFEGRA